MGLLLSKKRLGAIGIGNVSGSVDSPMSFHAPLTTTLVQTLGAGSPTFTRTTTAWVQDFEGLFKAVKSGEARFQGARRVENLVSTKSEDISNAAWTKTNGSADSAVRFRATSANATCLQSRTESGHTYRLRAKIKRVTGTGDVQLTLDNSSFTTITLTSNYQIFSISGAVTNPNFGVRIVTSGDEIDITEIQLTQVTGQANTNPSEYVSVGVLSSPFHGAGVDGVKYYNYQNGNTVDGSGVVTEAQGAAIAESTLKGVLIEGQRTTYAIWTNDMTNVAWTKTDMNTSFTATGPAGIPNNATILTATAANATATQSITRTSAQRVTGVFLKRSTGTGTISITQDNGATWTDVTITSSWALYTLPAATLANPVIGIRIATSGDAVDATWWQHSEASFVSSPIPNNSATTSVTRNGDGLSYPSAGNIDGTKGSVSAAFIVSELATVAKHIIVTESSDNGRPIYTLAGGAIRTFDGTNVVSGGNATINTLMKVCSSWDGSTMKQSANGGAVVSGSFDGSIGGNIIFIGSRASILEPAFGTIKNVKIWKRALSNARMIQETTP